MDAELTARDLMTRDLFVVVEGLPLAELEWELCRRRISGAPVVRDGRLVGLVTRADIVRRVGMGYVLSDLVMEFYRELEGRLTGAPSEGDTPQIAAETLGEQLSGLCVRDAMTHQPITVGPDTPVAEVAKLMYENRIHRVIVVEDHRPVGLIATLDLIRLLAGRGLPKR